MSKLLKTFQEFKTFQDVQSSQLSPNVVLVNGRSAIPVDKIFEIYLKRVNEKDSSRKKFNCFSVQTFFHLNLLPDTNPSTDLLENYENIS